MAAVVHDRSVMGRKESELPKALERQRPQVSALKTDWIFLSSLSGLIGQAGAFGEFAAAVVVGWQLVVCMGSVAEGSESGVVPAASDEAEALSCEPAKGSLCGPVDSEERRGIGWRSDEGWTWVQDRCR